jgi:hypothetical protein
MANHTHGGGEHPALHGMLVFGTGTIYLSHLPMFMSPHERQLILEVQFQGPGDPAGVYRRDRGQNGEKIYTWVPRPFVLTDLVNAGAGPARMQGAIVRGHFERGGTAITGDDVQCDVVKVIHSQLLSAKGPQDAQLKYLTFGTAAEAFAVHLISAPPDFDQVVSVESSIAPGASGRTVVADGRQNGFDRRIRPDERIGVRDGDTVGTLRCIDEIYLERDELKS